MRSRPEGEKGGGAIHEEVQGPRPADTVVVGLTGSVGGLAGDALDQIDGCGTPGSLPPEVADGSDGSCGSSSGQASVSFEPYADSDDAPNIVRGID